MKLKLPFENKVIIEIPPSPSVDNIWAMVIVWRLRGKIVRTVLCIIVYSNSAQWYAHIYQLFLQLTVIFGLLSGLLFVCFLSVLISHILFLYCLLLLS